MGGETQQLRVGKMTGHVGFDSLPDQLVNKEASNGFTFNILCVGETGIGKSTLMNSLFNSKFDSTPSNHDLPIVKLRPNTYELKEGNIKLRLTVIETSGYGDQVDKTDTSGSIVQYIDDQFEAYLQEELKLRRALNTYHDTRVHCCLYFLAPTGHTLKAIDLVTMKRLDSKVNIVPVIGKSDTIMRSELQRFKQRIVEEMRAYGVRTYEFATDDDTVAESNTQMNALVPFAVVASDDEVKVGGKVVRAREYPWGVVVVNNEQHCDFVKLREALIRTNMEELREKTHTVHYEAYRRQRLQEMGYSDEKMSLQETYEHRRQLLLGEQQRKEEEMRQMFVQRIKEKEAELKEAEKALHEKFENLKKFQADEKRRLEEKKRQLDEESAVFAKRKQQVEQQKQQNAISATSFAATLKNKKK